MTYESIYYIGFIFQIEFVVYKYVKLYASQWEQHKINLDVIMELKVTQESTDIFYTNCNI